MMTDAEEWFVDTNVLVYATNIDSPWYSGARETLARARQAGVGLAVSPQVLREYLVTSTRDTPGSPRREEILRNVAVLQKELRILDEDRIVASKLLELVEKFGVSGKQVHDANIVATMLVHGITHLLTYNIRDFTRFHGEVILVPPVEPEDGEFPKHLPRPAP